MFSVPFVSGQPPLNIDSGDILQSGSVITFSVPPHVRLTLTGEGFAGNSLQFNGEVDVPALLPGDQANPQLILRLVGELIGTISEPGFNDSIIEMYEVDTFGRPRRDALVTGTVDANSNYSIVLPEGIEPSSEYIFRVSSNSNQADKIEARYTNANVNVRDHILTINRQTNAVSDILAKLGDTIDSYGLLDEISVQEIDELDRMVSDINNQMNDAGSATFELYRRAINAQIDANYEYRNIVSSIVTSGEICGTVTLDANEALKGIRIEVYGFKDRLLYATAITDIAGSYCVNVPNQGEYTAYSRTNLSGEYVVGAINEKGIPNLASANAASAWWVDNTTNTPLRIDAMKIALPGVQAADFNLSPGVSLFGSVTGAGGEADIPLTGITVMLRDSKTHFVAASTQSNSSGQYQFNVMPGDYILEVQNTTAKPGQVHASGTYTDASPGIHNNLNFGSIIKLGAVGSAGREINLKLSPGVRVSSVLSDPSTAPERRGSAYGARVAFNLGDVLANGPSTRLRVKNVDGSFGVWLKPDVYTIATYGQSQTIDTRLEGLGTTIELTKSFSDSVAKLPIMVQPTLVDGQIAKLSQIKFELIYVRFLADSGGQPYQLFELYHTEFSRSDGSLELYSTNDDADHVVVATINQVRTQDRPYSSTVYASPGRTQRSAGDRIRILTGTPELPEVLFVPLQLGGTLTGTVTAPGSGMPIPNVLVTVNNTDIGNRDPLFVQTRTRSDGTYVLSLPEKTYDSVVLSDTSGVGADIGASETSCTLVSVVANETTTLDITLGMNSNGCQSSPVPGV